MIRALWLAIALLTVSAASLEQRPPDDDRVIALVKGTPARDFDSTLPKMRFERWLLDVVGPRPR